MTQATELRRKANGRRQTVRQAPAGVMPRSVAPQRVHNSLYLLLGGAVLMANALRHRLRGYRTPRPFDLSHVDRGAQYDLDVVQSWLGALQHHIARDFSLDNRTILELGPGPDLGTGLVLLAGGARAYHALDVVDLATAAPTALYDELLTRLALPETKADSLRQELAAAVEGREGRVNFVCDPGFNLLQFAGRGIDLVVSQAAFEHFENPGKVIAQLSEAVVPGALLVAEIDLQTHSRWLRDADPLNIYRFSDGFYDACRFTGSPNRWRPADYIDALRRNGWRDISITPLAVLDPAYLKRVQPSLAEHFRAPEDEMEVLSFAVCARKDAGGPAQ